MSCSPPNATVSPLDLVSARGGSTRDVIPLRCGMTQPTGVAGAPRDRGNPRADGESQDSLKAGLQQHKRRWTTPRSQREPLVTLWPNQEHSRPQTAACGTPKDSFSWLIGTTTQARGLRSTAQAEPGRSRGSATNEEPTAGSRSPLAWGCRRVTSGCGDTPSDRETLPR
jgi:hypothetical protein